MAHPSQFLARVCGLASLSAQRAEPTQTLADDEEADIAEGDCGDHAANCRDCGSGVVCHVDATVRNGHRVSTEGERSTSQTESESESHFFHVSFFLFCFLFFVFVISPKITIINVPKVLFFQNTKMSHISDKQST